MIETELTVQDGRTLHLYDTGVTESTRLTVFWHHGTPNIGAPPQPLFAESERLGIRWVSIDRPGYGGSSPEPGRDVASIAAHVHAAADALDIANFAVLGHSGGGPHALACAALLPERVTAAVSVSGMAPFGADGLDWFAGMSDASAASLRAALAGREAKQRHEATAEFDPETFTEADHAALQGDWSWVLSVVGPAVEAGPDALIDDDLAYVSPWGFDPARIQAPTLIVHGERDRMVPSTHGEWLAARCPNAELWLSPDDGHVSVLDRAPSTLEWLAAACT